MNNWNFRKPVLTRDEMPEHHRLAKTLGWPHLVALGVGAIVGTGILTLIGVGAGKAGPAVIVSFAIAGLICACAALAYAEVATMIPASGSAYTYSYVVFGELLAWMIGVALILEYSLVVSAVAVGWSGYAAPLLAEYLSIPTELMKAPELGGIINLPAIFIIVVVAGLLLAGTRESASFNAILVVIKLAALALFIAVALPVFNADNFTPIMPNGFPRTGPPGSALDAYQVMGWAVQARYDSTRNLLDPRAGIRAQGSVIPSYAFVEGTPYVPVRLNGATYFDLLGEGRGILAMRAGVGSLVNARAQDAPPSQRFFAGGGGSVRGYDFQSIGPRDARGRPLGGASLLEGSIEWRQPERMQLER